MAVLEVLLAALAVTGAATNLYVSSYAGSVTTLSLTKGNSGYDLTNTSSSQGCGSSPSWLELDKATGILYCIDEGLSTPNGSINTLKTSTNGVLTPVEHHDTITGPVSGIFYNSGKESAIALAHYSGSAISAWHTTAEGKVSYIENITFSMNRPGPVAARQEAPHEHEAILDPTGRYLLFPDLGADLVRVYSFDASTSSLVEREPLKADPGSGPRHAVFWSPDKSYARNSTLYFFLIHELSNTITSYRVRYEEAGGLAFEKVQTINTFGGKTVPTGAAAAEIIKTPDNGFIISSNRNDTSFLIDNPDPKNSTKIASDSLSVWQPAANGTLSFIQLAPAGGSYPRQFSINKVGDLVSVGLQMGSAVVVWNRDLKTGKLGDLAARIGVPGQITCVVWDE
ncbi:putative isomerase YbhE [Glonium stellatum]|uniref:Putative isomerase YbhE n=1 Tax=Glonium stellatum TaxID=574774 RepID=A0A8E2JR30_9PEZI|nr:putative isomerase YbhE [Glonium stellatum]